MRPLQQHQREIEMKREGVAIPIYPNPPGVSLAALAQPPDTLPRNGEGYEPFSREIACLLSV